MAAAKAELPDKVVLDGELGVPALIGDTYRLDWDSLSQRIHPAESRISMLAEKTPAVFIGFDALALGEVSVLDEPFEVRRRTLLGAVDSAGGRDRTFQVSRVTTDPEMAGNGSRRSRVPVSTAWWVNAWPVRMCRTNAR